MFCGKCGYDLKSEKVSYCPHCGAPVNNQSLFNTKSEEKAYAVMDEKRNLGLAKRRNFFIAVYIIIVFAVVVIGISFFRGSYDLVGTWVCEDDNEWTVTFNEDGKYYDSQSYFLYYNKVGNWNVVSDGMLYFSCVGFSDTYEYELGVNTLKIYTKNSMTPFYVFKKIKD